MVLAIHTTGVAVVLAAAFGGLLAGTLLWMLRAPRAASAHKARVQPHPAERGLILVPIEGDGGAPEHLALAAELAQQRRGAVLLVRIIEVPWTLPLGAPMERADREARAALDAAKEAVSDHGVAVHTLVRRARVAAAGILEAARDCQADLIYGPYPARRHGRR